MRKSKFVIVGVIAATGIMLAACSQQNPLQKQDKKATVSFLLKAAQSTEAKLKLSPTPNGMLYRGCMDNKVKQSTCTTLYKGMIDYAKNSKGYENLTIAELTNQKTWATIRPAYIEAGFNAL